MEDALDVEVDDGLENHLRPFLGCVYLVATKQLNVFEKAFANVKTVEAAYELVEFFEVIWLCDVCLLMLYFLQCWKDCLLECNHTFQEISLESTYQYGERGMLDDYYHKDLFCFTLMEVMIGFLIFEGC